MSGDFTVPSSCKGAVQILNIMNNVKNKIHSVEWYRIGENQYLGGEQEGILYVICPNGNRVSLRSRKLLGNGAIHRENIGDITDREWSLLQHEYDKIMTEQIKTTSGYALREYKPVSKSKRIDQKKKKTWRLF